jgi:hypothetical protein
MSGSGVTRLFVLVNGGLRFAYPSYELPVRPLPITFFAIKIAPTNNNKRRKQCAALYSRANADWS